MSYFIFSVVCFLLAYWFDSYIPAIPPIAIFIYGWFSVDEINENNDLGGSNKTSGESNLLMPALIDRICLSESSTSSLDGFDQSFNGYDNFNDNDGVVINPATGLMMPNGMAGPDVSGSPYGADLQDSYIDDCLHDSLSDDSFMNDSFNSFDDSFSSFDDSFNDPFSTY